MFRNIYAVLFLCLLSLNFLEICVGQFDDDVTDLDGNFCRQKYSCNETYINDRNCNCDFNCVLYNDCCSDFTQTPNKTQQLKPSVPNFMCEFIQEIDQDSFIFLVQNCPEDTNQEIKQACEGNTTGLSDIPVSGINTGYLYKNMYCAVCHMEDYVFWKVGFSCNWTHSSDVNKTLKSVRNDDHCQKILTPPEENLEKKSRIRYSARQCFPVINTCMFSDHELECKHGERELVFDHDVFKNIDCAICNNLKTENLTCSSRTWKSRPKLKRKRTNYSYRLLFDISSSETRETFRKRHRRPNTESKKKACPSFEIYDIFSDTCRQVNCMLPLIYKNGKCIYNIANTSENMPSVAIGNDKKKCIYVRLNDTEYTIINQMYIFIYSINKTLANDSFYQSGNVTYVCKEAFLDTTDDKIKHVYDGSESILSLVGSVLSIAALTITLILYLRFPKLQNVPGKSLICLMVSLILAQLLFMLANSVEDYHHICIGFAVTIHYAFLASVFWMNCMSFDIFITFSKGFVKSDGDKGKTFLFYSLYAWLVPLVIVITGFLLDVATLNEYRPRYGEIVCWIGNKQAVLVYFVVPIGLAVTANLFFYVFTVRAIFISNRQSNRILRQKKTCKLVVYVKLSIVMGLTWIFAYVASFTNETVFWYLFIFFNSWQGVFIFISFVCFGKVRSQITERVSVMSSYFKTRTTTSTLTDSSRHK